jgi:outer membrane protein OmpA-like peptidoglycan-associated protein
MMTTRLLHNSTALALVLAMSLPMPHGAFAQENAVDCAADPSNPVCLEQSGRQPAAEEAPAEPAPEPEQPAAEQPAEEQPAPAEEAPQTEQPAAEQPAAEEPAEETPAEEVPAEEPAAEQPAAEEQPADEQPVTEEPVPSDEQPEAGRPAEEQPAAEEPAVDQPAEEAPAEEQSSDEPAAEQPATEETATDEPATEQPATEETTTQEQPAEQPQRTEDAREEPGEPVQAENTEQPEEPAAVVPDEITEEQRQQIQAQENQRREEARDRRRELLGAAAVGVGIGMLVPALGGKVVEDQGDRIIVERDGEYFVRKDESSLLRYGDAEVRVERLRGGRTRETVTRDNGVQIITIRDEGGYVLYRSRIMPDGREYVLIDNRDPDRDRRRRDWDRELPPLRVDIPRERYIVPARRADYDVIYETFIAPPVEEVEQAYSLREVRESERLRDKVRRVDLDTITFETGSATVRQSQVPLLEDLARASIALIEQDPSTVLLVEGHTDAVGSDISNLALSDRRAETVARILAEIYGVPPENMVVQGYGEDYLKVDTEGPSEENRRVTLRNITQLLSARGQ